MRFLCFLLGITFVITPLSLISQEAEEQEEIDKWLDNCLEEYHSTAGSVECITQAQKKWDGELNTYYQKLKEVMGEEEMKVLKESQRAWIDYRDKEFAWIENYFVEQKEGTMYLIMCANQKMEVVRKRALELRYYFEMLEY